MYRHSTTAIPRPAWLISFCAFVPTLVTATANDPSAHKDWIARLKNRELILVGDSGTQCVMQNVNIDYRKWIDDSAKAGLNAIHIWSFMAPRQTKDGSVIEGRYGYVYPGITPWARKSNGPAARDGLPRWNLREFDEGDDPNQHYWPRLRDVCRYAKKKKLLVGITVFFGWPKHQADWAWHPFNEVNGGHLTDRGRIIQAVQQITTPGREMLEKPWSDAWSDPQKTQWLWEQFAAKLIKETKPIGNTFYIFMDERSYPEGNCGDHFATFFRKRGAFWIDGQLRREKVDGVTGGQGAGRDINRSARESFAGKPERPFFEFELPPYKGKAVRRNLYACLLGGGHYFHHNDADQETPTTGIMSYDPNVKNDRPEMVQKRLQWLGTASRLINEVATKSGMSPHNEIIKDGKGYCLAAPRSKYVVYIKNGGEAALQFDHDLEDFKITATNPRTGERGEVEVSIKRRGMVLEFLDREDWVVVIARKLDR